VALMGHALKLYGLLLRAQIRSQWQYRVSFGLDLISTMMVSGLEFAAFALVTVRFGGIGGWSLGQVALLYGLAEFSFGLMDLVFGGFDAPNISQNVRKGNLDGFLLRPVSLTLQIFGSEFALRRLGRIALGSGILIYALSLNPVNWTLERLVLVPLSVLGLMLFFGGLFIVGGTLTFWTVENVEAMNILTYGGNTLISYPLHIYQEWLRRLFTFVLPAAFLSYYPVLYLLGKPLPLGVWSAFVSPLAGFVIFAAAFRFWRFGLRYYQGTGS
jgi:ABC-2 type transport system permease protein